MVFACKYFYLQIPSHSHSPKWQPLDTHEKKIQKFSFHSSHPSILIKLRDFHSRQHVRCYQTILTSAWVLITLNLFHCKKMAMIAESSCVNLLSYTLGNPQSITFLVEIVNTSAKVFYLVY